MLVSSYVAMSFVSSKMLDYDTRVVVAGGLCLRLGPPVPPSPPVPFCALLVPAPGPVGMWARCMPHLSYCNLLK